jgi:GH25 family lysozyme M1 (1,4-beta-N-acetylmuramidase)
VSRTVALLGVASAVLAGAGQAVAAPETATAANRSNVAMPHSPQLMRALAGNNRTQTVPAGRIPGNHAASRLAPPAGVAGASAGTANLLSGQQLTGGQSVVSGNSEYQLTMQTDGNLVEYVGSRVLWQSHTAGNSGAYVVMQGDGNLVLYSGTNQPLWWTGTSNPGATVTLQDDANLMVHSGTTPLWANGATNGQVDSGQRLTGGQSLENSTRHNSLVMQTDGNLVEYVGNRALWQSRTVGNSGAYVAMQADGNLVVYSATNQPLWWTGTSNPGATVTLQDDANLVVYANAVPLWSNGATNNQLMAGEGLSAGQSLGSANRLDRLAMQTDGNLVEYEVGRVLWQSGTGGHPGAYVVMQGDGNLVVYSATNQPLWWTGTGNHPGATANLQDDANLVVYGGSTPFWANYAVALPVLAGVDVASFQHPNGAGINWAQVAGAGYRFAAVKATEGTYYKNPYFAADDAGAKAAGLDVAAYHFATPDTTDGATQADYAVNNASYTADGKTLPIELDIEYNPYGAECYGKTPAAMIAWITAFSNEVAGRTGRAPMIYTTADWWNTCTGGSYNFSGNPLWIAAYGTAAPPMPAGWGAWTFWQYTSTGTVPGIPTQGGTDVSHFVGNIAALAR